MSLNIIVREIKNGQVEEWEFSDTEEAENFVNAIHPDHGAEVIIDEGDKQWVSYFREEIPNPIKYIHSDPVNNPSHYNHGGIETIELIKAFLSPEEWRGYLKGTLYAYRDRAPYKGQTEQDYEKAKRYWEWLKEAMGETK